MFRTDQTHVRKICILLADDHRQVREQLAARLRRETGFEIVGVASTGPETWEQTQSKHPHILLIDPFMRDGLGLATLRQVRTKFPDLVIVVLTAYVDTALNMYFHELGIQHILTKGIGPFDLIAELRTAYASVRFPDS